jgi:hypothetical protein
MAVLIQDTRGRLPRPVSSGGAVATASYSRLSPMVRPALNYPYVVGGATGCPRRLSPGRRSSFYGEDFSPPDFLAILGMQEPLNGFELQIEDLGRSCVELHSPIAVTKPSSALDSCVTRNRAEKDTDRTSDCSPG